jgi:hypothetical protein
VSRLALKHIEHLACVIGPRGTCTPAEHQASEYCRQVLTDLGYDAHVQPFRVAVSGWAPYSIGGGLMLLSLGAFLVLPPGVGRPLSALLAVFVTVSTCAQLAFRPSPLERLVPHGTSHNVHVVVHSRREPARTVVVAGHVDTHRTPLVMASPLAFRGFQGLTTLGVLSYVVLTVAFIASLVWALSIPTLALAVVALVITVVFVVTLQPEFTPFVPGANDNASGAAAVLALAARLKAEPLERTQVWLLNSGAEEVGATGPLHLLKSHPELRDADWLVIDTIAGPGAGPCLITAEHIVFPLRADPGLLAQARAVANARPDLGAYEHYYRGLSSEHSTLTAAGCRSLALINFTRRGVLPNWHRPTDTVANIDPDVLDRTEQFVWSLLQRLDAAPTG